MSTNKTHTSDDAFIEAHVKFSKNVLGFWQASFTCADGFQYTIADFDPASTKTAKSRLKSDLIARVIAQRKHPIQRNF